MKRALILGLMLVAIWGISYLYAGNAGDFYEFKGGTTKTAGQEWLSATDRFFAPFGWYDTTAVFDTLIDTMYSSVAYLGHGTLEKMVVKYYVSALDTFASADSMDTVLLRFEFSNTDSFSSTWLWTYAIAGIAANQTAYTTWNVTDADTILVYPGYNYARCRLIYRCVWDSTVWEANTGNVAADVWGEHVPVTLNTAYYPIWK